MVDGQSFVAMDGEDEFAASGMGLTETKALLESGDGGAAYVMVLRIQWSLTVKTGFVGLNLWIGRRFELQVR